MLETECAAKASHPDNQDVLARTRRLVTVSLTALLLAGCAALPSSGPTTQQVIGRQDPAPGVPYDIVNVTSVAEIPAQTAAPLDWAVPPSRGLRIVVGPGDVLSIRIFELGTRLFSGGPSGGMADVSAPSAVEEALPPVQIDEAGDISLPYVGSLHVADLSTQEVEQLIVRRYQGYSQALRAMVTISGNATNKVLVSGAVGRSGRYPITAARERLLDVIADAGGVTARAEDLVVRFTHDGSVSTARLRDVIDKTGLNVPLRPGDMVEIQAQPRTYLVFGAAERVSQVPFNADRVSLAEAIAQSGGPMDARADPKGVFLFRYDPNDKSGRRTIYRIDLMRPDTYFLTQQFYLQDKDVLYFANARANQPSKFVQILNQLFSPFLTVRAIAN